MSKGKTKDWVFIEYKREGDKEWQLFRAMQKAEFNLNELAKAKELPDAVEVRIRYKVTCSCVVEKWKRNL